MYEHTHTQTQIALAFPKAYIYTGTMHTFGFPFTVTTFNLIPLIKSVVGPT